MVVVSGMRLRGLLVLVLLALTAPAPGASTATPEQGGSGTSTGTPSARPTRKRASSDGGASASVSKEVRGVGYKGHSGGLHKKTSSGSKARTFTTSSFDEEDFSDEYDNALGEAQRLSSAFDEEGGLKSTVNWARHMASKYGREAKGAFSSELEQITLKATRPDETAVKAKHLEALLQPSYELPKEVSVYSTSVKKLWSKMTEKDWRVVMKSLYVLHRFAQDGCLAQSSNLRETIISLQTQLDPKRKVLYFDFDTICRIEAQAWSPVDIEPYEDFVRRYGKYVMVRAAWFGPGFSELLDDYAMLLQGKYPGGIGTGMGVGIGQRSCLSAVKEVVTAGLRCRFGSLACPVLVDAQLAVARDLHDVLEVAAAQLDWLRHHPPFNATAVGSGGEQDEYYEEYHEEDREVEERLYRAELDRWRAFLESRSRRVAEFIKATNELAAKYDMTQVAGLSIAPAVLKRWREREARQRKRDQEAQATRPSLSATSPGKIRVTGPGKSAASAAAASSNEED